MKGHFVKKQTNQSGNILLVIIIFLAVILIGFIGYIFYQNFNQSKSADVIKQPISEITPAPIETPTDNVIVPETPTTPINSNDPNVLIIAGWNIKGLYTGSHIVNYQIISSSYIQFTSDDLTGSCADYKLGFIYRRTGDQLISTIGEFGFDNSVKNMTVSKYYTQGNAKVKANTKHIGNYYYIYVSPQASCSTDNTATNIANDVFGFFKTLQSL